MAEFRTVVLDGRAVLMPVIVLEPPKNPPLAALNASYRHAEAERKDETEENIEVVAATLRNKLSGQAAMARRAQKPLRPPVR